MDFSPARVIPQELLIDEVSSQYYLLMQASDDSERMLNLSAQDLDWQDKGPADVQRLAPGPNIPEWIGAALFVGPEVDRYLPEFFIRDAADVRS